VLLQIPLHVYDLLTSLLVICSSSLTDVPAV
jgi:hypothetical protein